MNRVTGEIDILQSVHAADAGTVMNPLQCTGQVEGGVAQGIGWAMIENMIIDEHGAVTNPTLRNYRIPAFCGYPADGDLFCNHDRHCWADGCQVDERKPG